MDAETDGSRAPLLLTPKEVDLLNRCVTEKLGDALRLSIWMAIGGSHRSESTAGQEYEFLPSVDTLLVTDDRGLERVAVPFISNASSGQHLLLSLNLSWIRAGKAKLRFSGARIIVFLAWGHAKPKETLRDNRRQLIRLEWAGIDVDGFEAKVAAHPHWQIDRWTAGYEATYRRVLASEDVPAREFGVGPDVMPPRDVAWVRRVHLAAGARWADEPWDGSAGDCWTHAYGPRDQNAIANWVLSSLRYISSQCETAFSRLD